MYKICIFITKRNTINQCLRKTKDKKTHTETKKKKKNLTSVQWRSLLKNHLGDF